MSREWKSVIVCPLYKKENPLHCENYRGITLLCVSYKILANIIYGRLHPYLKTIIDKYQCEFIREKSITDQIFTLQTDTRDRY